MPGIVLYSHTTRPFAKTSVKNSDAATCSANCSWSPAVAGVPYRVNAPRVPAPTDNARCTPSNRCALAIWERIQAHPCLTRIERDGEDLYYTFQWPRDLEPFREPICIAFKEQNQNIQWWDGFKRSWALITRDMGPMPPSLREQTEAVEPVPNDDGDVDFAADIDFGSPDTPTLPPQADIPNIPLNAPAPPKVKRGPGRPPKEKLPPPPTPSSRLDTRLTLVNITCLLNNALADLAREPNQIEVWTEFSAALKEARELAEAVKTLMAQPGA